MPTPSNELNEMERLIEDIVFKIEGEICCNCEQPCRCYKKAAEEVYKVILADRKRMLDEVEKPLLKAQPVAKTFGRYDDLWDAQCEALAKIEKLKGIQ